MASNSIFPLDFQDGIYNDDFDGGALPCVDPWLALTAAALQTKSIMLGTTVTPLPRRRPHKLARETVSLDRLSNGRLILSVGLVEERGSMITWVKR